MLFKQHNFLSKKDCKSLISVMDRNEQLWNVGSGVIQKPDNFHLCVTKRYYGGLSVTDKEIELIQKIKISTTEIAKSALDDQNIYIDHPGLVLWKPGSAMGLHADNCNYITGEPNLSPNRVYAVLVYLNDEYTGGNLIFRDLDNISPETGLAVGFPSGPDYAHGVSKVHHHPRYTFVAWFAQV